MELVETTPRVFRTYTRRHLASVKLCEDWEVLVRYFDLIPELISLNATPGVLDIVVTSLHRAKFRDVV